MPAPKNVIYHLASPNWNGFVSLAYDAEYGNLHRYELCTLLPPEQVSKMLATLPLSLTMLEALVAQYPKLSIVLQPQDLSFQAFWNQYANKVGNKARAEKLWNKLTDAERSQCFDALPAYDYYLRQRPTMERCYAETFLAQQRWLHFI